jgi:hypothetical protein
MAKGFMNHMVVVIHFVTPAATMTYYQRQNNIDVQNSRLISVIAHSTSLRRPALILLALFYCVFVKHLNDKICICVHVL